MLLNKFKDRYFVTTTVFVMIFTIILFRLADLMIVNGETYREQAENRIFKSIELAAPRGEIRDRYGRLIAGNRTSYTVQIMKNEVTGDSVNDVALRLTQIFESNGDQYVDEFPIIVDDNGQYHFTFDLEKEDWKERNDLLGVETASEAFQILLDRHGIQEESVGAAQIELLNYMSSVPISVANPENLRFTYDMRKQNWLQDHGIRDPEEIAIITAKEAFDRVRERPYDLESTYSAEDARRIMVIKEQLRKTGFLQYQPVRIAHDVSKESIIQIEENIMELPGVNVAFEPIRYYPEGETAAHILGYMGKISQTHEIEKYVNELGYNPNDMIGKTGIEEKFEETLKGTNGSQNVIVDSRGRLVNVIETVDPVPGNTIYLTIDLNIQKKAEEVLKVVLETLQVGGVYETQWGSARLMGSAGIMKNAKSASVVVTDVNTGEVLALANYPSYDPNLFATGISTEDWNSLHPENTRDLLAPSPLNNIALSTAIQPGSTYKMLVGLAAIEQGLDPNYKILDRGFIQVGGHSFGNWLWNQGRGQTMGWQGLHQAIADSNNYYFYSLGTGYDHGIERWLPISMNVDTFIDYSHRFGLNDRTGIEIDVPRERSGGVPSVESKTRTIKALLTRQLERQLRPADFEEIIGIPTQEEILDIIEEIVSWTEENPSRPVLYNRLVDIGLQADKASIFADLIKFTYFNQARWSKADTMNFSIGQGEHAYTPIQMTNYMAILANGGYRYKVSVLNKITDFEGNIISEHPPELIERIPMNDYSNLDEVNYGMYLVNTTGTARSHFSRFPIDVAGKTGTAQRSGKIPPLDEVEYLKRHLGAFGVTEAAVYEQMEIMRTEDRDNPRIHDDAYVMREAIKQLNPRIKNADLDHFKEDYDNFAWYTGFAPYENPEIAISVLIFQGGSGGYGAPIFREIVAEYMGLNIKEDSTEMIMQNRLTQ
ncbi:penicillin-binding transpeptidase domain-containing protein [Alkaliphilus transvaalensis]|uniref:penicillin-binding transpeptidase domain-containing protein n=1 Tax=Alkaliphilus transvaalensis TaxID=114628 RepID=UPI00047BE7DB|nr:penicillin-binding transpeptidase domain-containing protein [Alkaliphilus transvaalensis]